jgi:mono/diheme cytochrome c family protein
MRRLSILLLVATLLSSYACKVSKPGSIETNVMKEVKTRMSIGGKDDPNPVPDNQASIAEGRAHFGHHCQICHGLDGQNTGVPFAQQMSPPVADLASSEIQAYTDGQMHWILQNGIAPSGMPAWHGVLEDDEMWKIVRYIRHLPPKGSLGIPDIFREEEEEHKATEAGSAHQHSAAPHHHHHQ